MEYNIYIGDDELVHYGVAGMRWGIRRYQNKDGSLTKAGKKKLRAETAKVREQEKVNKNRKSTQAKIDRLVARKKAADDEKKELDKNDKARKGKTKSKKNSPDDEKNAKKAVKDMTNEELANAIVRSRLEDEYRRYNPEPEPKRGFASKFIDDAVKPAVINAGRQLLQDSITKLGKNLLKDKVDPDSFEALEATYKRLDVKTKIDKILNPDKYLSEEDKTKRADREYKAEDRAAQKEGYKDAADKAQKERARADAVSGARSRARANATVYGTRGNRDKSGAKLDQDDFDFGDSSANNSSRSTSTSTGLSVVRRMQDSSSSGYSSSTKSAGKSAVTKLLDDSTTVRDDGKLMRYDEDGRFIGYWSDTSGDVDGII